MSRVIRFALVIAIVGLFALPAVPEPAPDGEDAATCKHVENFTVLVVKAVGQDYTIKCQNDTPARLAVVHPGEYVAWDLRLASRKETLEFDLDGKRLFEKDIRELPLVRKQWSVVQIWKDAKPGTTQYEVKGRAFREHPGPGIIVCPPGSQPCP